VNRAGGDHNGVAAHMNPADYFSPDYATARERFCARAQAAGAQLYTLPLDARAPDGGPLAIDIGWLGARQPRRVLLHVCGVHGVEAYAGSAVQLALLSQPPAIGPDDALILVHVLNPYGMAWLRRANENNVDLNRNFLMSDERYGGAPPLYRELDPLLNPPTPPGFDAFALRAMLLGLRHGRRALLAAVAHGQYDYPRGLFFGGNHLQQGPRLFLEWLAPALGAARYLFVLDLHTGLGPWRGDLLMTEPGVGCTPAVTLCTALRRPVREGANAAYATRGALGGAIPRALPTVPVDFLLQELGTYSTRRVFHALREENRWHFCGDGTLQHRSKQRLLEALSPAASRWRRTALNLGTTLAARAAAWTFDKERDDVV